MPTPFHVPATSSSILQYATDRPVRLRLPLYHLVVLSEIASDSQAGYRLGCKRLLHLRDSTVCDRPPMNWFGRGNSGDSDGSNPQAEPDASELRRRRLARLEAEQARAAELAERRARWEASRVLNNDSASSTTNNQTEPGTAERHEEIPPTRSTDAAMPSCESAPSQAQMHARVYSTEESAQELQPPRRSPTALPPLHVMETSYMANMLGIALNASKVTDEAPYLPELLDSLPPPSNSKSRLPEDDDEMRDVTNSDEKNVSTHVQARDQHLVITALDHADEILLHRINTDSRPLAYLLAVYNRGLDQISEIAANRRLDAEQRGELLDAVRLAMRAALLYTGLLLGGSFGDDRLSTPEAFAAILMDTDAGLPSGFIAALLERYSSDESLELEDLRPVFVRILVAIREEMVTNGSLSHERFLSPLRALSAVLVYQPLCNWLIEDSSFIPTSHGANNGEMKVGVFTSVSYLSPFFQVSALRGLPIGPRQIVVEDPEVEERFFPQPSTILGSEVESAMLSLRGSLKVARSYMFQICKTLCKAGEKPRNAVLTWFGIVLNLNKKRMATQVDYRDVSGDGFMLNVAHVLLNLCEPIIRAGWSKLSLIDCTYPQSSHRLDYTDETRLAADSNLLRLWWVDQRNENAQESLQRALRNAEREAGTFCNASSGSQPMAASSSEQPRADSASDITARNSNDLSDEAVTVSTEFNFVTEIFFIAIRAVQVGFVPVVTLYEETLAKSLSRLKSMVDEMEGNEARTTRQNMELGLFKARFDQLLRTKLSYDVYLHDEEFLGEMVVFVSGVAEWLVKSLLSEPQRPQLLPLPLPPRAVFASLPEHCVEIVATVLITTMHHRPDVIERNYHLLDNILTFSIAAASSPLHVKNPYLRAKLVEFLSAIFPQPSGIVSISGLDDDDDEDGGNGYQYMEELFLGHKLSCAFLPAALLRLYVDVEHTGSHTQFYDKFSIRYRIGTILKSAWHFPVYRTAIRTEAADEISFVRFVNMLLNDANHLLDETLNDLEEIRGLEQLINSDAPEWTSLSDEDKQERISRLSQMTDMAKSYNLLSNNSVKLLCLLTDDEVVRRVFLRPEMVNRIAEMLNYLLKRLCGDRCRDLKVSDPEKVAWKPRLLLSRVMHTYIHFGDSKQFATAMARDGRSYSDELLQRAASIAERRAILHRQDVESFRKVAQMASQASLEDEQEEEDLGEVPDEFLDPIMSTIMVNPVRLPTSGNVMDRDVISRILLSDKMDPFNRMFLSEDMLEDVPELKAQIEEFRRSRIASARASKMARVSSDS